MRIDNLIFNVVGNEIEVLEIVVEKFNYPKIAFINKDRGVKIPNFLNSYLATTIVTFANTAPVIIDDIHFFNIQGLLEPTIEELETV